eukprot:TRINITY_DN83016_c0_g1_i1.p1 TRINITY_DN83016_c0_g1~~TRINITY_DN83016_c0_g1_i1.p1  ORF type:complete len:251 (+),score=39.87 TRINITY_DN83016_c0_g1_i1:65-754(+)
MPGRIGGVSRKRLCLFMLQARRQPKCSANASSSKRKGSKPKAEVTRHRCQSNHREEVQAPILKRSAKRPKQSIQKRMFRTHSLRDIAHLMRPSSLDWASAASWDLTSSDSDVDDDVMLPCGLGASEAVSMMHRELTPEDYEKLCKLDEALPKRDTLEQGQVAKLPRLPASELKEGMECGVCLSELEASSEAVKLPCSHTFHVPCITRWLTQCKNTCPLCSKPITQPSVA